MQLPDNCLMTAGAAAPLRCKAETTTSPPNCCWHPCIMCGAGLSLMQNCSEPQSEAELTALIDAGLSMLVLADIGALGEEQAKQLNQWVERGGILLRFAGPRLAAAQDALLPVTLRQGDRALGSSLSWETPQGLASFPETSPFAGLAIDPAIKVATASACRTVA